MIGKLLLAATIGHSAVAQVDVAQKFFDCCETGGGWATCSEFVTSETAPFSVQAVDALSGPKITDAKTVKEYLDWMAGVVKAFGPKATYVTKASSFDEKTSTAMYYAVFGGFSDYVYAITIDPKEMKVSAMTKVWNDQFAANALAAAPSQLSEAVQPAVAARGIATAAMFGVGFGVLSTLAVQRLLREKVDGPRSLLG